VRVDFRRQAIALARLRQYVRAHPRLVVGELLAQRREVLLPTLEPALLIQVAHAVDVTLAIVEMPFDFGDPRPSERGVAHALFEPRAGQRRDRLIAFFCTDVAA